MVGSEGAAATPRPLRCGAGPPAWRVDPEVENHPRRRVAVVLFGANIDGEGVPRELPSGERLLRDDDPVKLRLHAVHGGGAGAAQLDRHRVVAVRRHRNRAHDRILSRALRQQRRVEGYFRFAAAAVPRRRHLRRRVRRRPFQPHHPGAPPAIRPLRRFRPLPRSCRASPVAPCVRRQAGVRQRATGPEHRLRRRRPCPSRRPRRQRRRRNRRRRDCAIGVAPPPQPSAVRIRIVAKHRGRTRKLDTGPPSYIGAFQRGEEIRGGNEEFSDPSIRGVATLRPPPRRDDLGNQRRLRGCRRRSGR